MSSASIAVASVRRRAVSPWLVAAAVVIPTFMEVLDTTVANVALRYIAGGLSSPATDSEWIVTSYLAANAIVLPISGWLAARLGRRNYFLLSIAVFTIASALCGMAPTLGVLVAGRVLQGLAGGGLQPSSQAILLDAFPPEKQGAAQTIFGIAALLAPVVGPTLGGFITDNYGWRWIFYLNLPVGLLAWLLCRALVEDPEYLVAERARNRAQGRPFDTLGLALLALTMISWEILLSKGQEWDWLGDPFHRIHALLACFVFGLAGLVWRELGVANPLVNFRTLRDRNFRSCCMIVFLLYAVLYANTVTLPALLQSLFGYDATTSGLVLSPAGIVAVAMLVVSGTLLSRGVDARYLMAAGTIVLAIGNFWLGQANLEVGPWQVVWRRVVVIAGLSMCFPPLNVAAFLYLPKETRGAAVGLLALLRNEGGSVGTSLAQIIEQRREQFHTLRLGEGLDALNPNLSEWLERSRQFFMQHTGDGPLSNLMALKALERLRERQALSLAFFDVFTLLSAASVVLLVLVLLMRRSVAQTGAQVGAE
ncbi:MAG TPA: MDR family MFS transporter [Burkholderiales bacterium]|nr:MDR family MFS transporter [Burkholderiales bacterium]